MTQCFKTKLVLSVRADCPLRISPRVLRIALIGDPIKSARRNLEALAEVFKNGSNTGQQSSWISDRLARIAGGEDPEIVLGLKRDNDLPRDPDRLTIMAVDYRMRTFVRPKQRKIAANVAHDWRQQSVDTVKQIHRRMQGAAQELIEHFVEQESQREDFDPRISWALYKEAIDAARVEILSGVAPPILKRPEDVIEPELHYHHLLRYYSQCE